MRLAFRLQKSVPVTAPHHYDTSGAHRVRRPGKTSPQAPLLAMPRSRAVSPRQQQEARRAQLAGIRAAAEVAGLHYRRSQTRREPDGSTTIWHLFEHPDPQLAQSRLIPALQNRGQATRASRGSALVADVTVPDQAQANTRHRLVTQRNRNLPDRAAGVVVEAPVQDGFWKLAINRATARVRAAEKGLADAAVDDDPQEWLLELEEAKALLAKLLEAKKRFPGLRRSYPFAKSLVAQSFGLSLQKAQPMNPQAAKHDTHGDGHWITVRGRHLFIKTGDEGKPLREILDVREDEGKNLVGKKLSVNDHTRLLENLGHKQRRAPRTSEEARAAFAKKLERVRTLDKKLPQVMRDIHHDLNLSDHERRRVEASVLALMFKANLRVGNEGSKEFGVSGATTISREEVQVAGDVVRLQFKGKSGVTWDVKIKDASLAKAMQYYCDSAKDGEPIFKVRSGKDAFKPLRDTDIRARLQKEYDFNPHDVRTHTASKTAFVEFQKVSAKDGETLTQKEIQARAKKVYEECARRLGNSWQQCRDNYIAPAIIHDFISNGGRVSLPEPKYDVAK